MDKLLRDTLTLLWGNPAFLWELFSRCFCCFFRVIPASAFASALAFAPASAPASAFAFARASAFAFASATAKSGQLEMLFCLQWTGFRRNCAAATVAASGQL